MVTMTMAMLILAAIWAILTAAGLATIWRALTQILFILRWFKVQTSNVDRADVVQSMPRPPDGNPQTPAEEYAAPMIRRSQAKLWRRREEHGYET